MSFKLDRNCDSSSKDERAACFARVNSLEENKNVDKKKNKDENENKDENKDENKVRIIMLLIRFELLWTIKIE